MFGLISGFIGFVLLIGAYGIYKNTPAILAYGLKLCDSMPTTDITTGLTCLGDANRNANHQYTIMWWLIIIGSILIVFAGLTLWVYSSNETQENHSSSSDSA